MIGLAAHWIVHDDGRGLTFRPSDLPASGSPGITAEMAAGGCAR